jgi:hypothetical protein
MGSSGAPLVGRGARRFRSAALGETRWTPTPRRNRSASPGVPVRGPTVRSSASGRRRGSRPHPRRPADAPGSRRRATVQRPRRSRRPGRPRDRWRPRRPRAWWPTAVPAGIRSTPLRPLRSTRPPSVGAATSAVRRPIGGRPPVAGAVVPSARRLSARGRAVGPAGRRRGARRRPTARRRGVRRPAAGPSPARRPATAPGSRTARPPCDLVADSRRRGRRRDADRRRRF